MGATLMDLTDLSEDAAKLLPLLNALPMKDQYILARYLEERIEGPTEDATEVQEAWKAEIHRRVEEIRSGKVEGIPIEEVFRRSREKHG
jgi:putative addiction module component (TIGR02574 family)